MMLSPTPEQRRAPRHTIQIRLDAHLLDQDLPLRADNVSRGGLFVTSKHAPPVGHALHVSLQLDGAHALEAVATVVRAEPGHGFAVRLSVAGEAGRRRWAEYLATLEGAVLGQPIDDGVPPPPWPRSLDPREVFDFDWMNDDG